LLVRAPVAHGRRHNVPGGKAQEARDESEDHTSFSSL
jgi:hypothetical protein